MMNIMTDSWSIFGRDQGQTVIVSHRYHEETDRIIRRTHDRSDDTIMYCCTPCPEDVQWNGSEGDLPGSGYDWTDCDNPFDD